MKEEVHRNNQCVRNKAWNSRNNLRFPWNKRFQNTSCLNCQYHLERDCFYFLKNFASLLTSSQWLKSATVRKFTHEVTKQCKSIEYYSAIIRNKLLIHLNNIEESGKHMLRKTCAIEITKRAEKNVF